MKKDRINQVERAVLKMFAEKPNKALFEDLMYEAGKIEDEKELDLGWELMKKWSALLSMGAVEMAGKLPEHLQGLQDEIDKIKKS